MEPGFSWLMETELLVHKGTKFSPKKRKKMGNENWDQAAIDGAHCRSAEASYDMDT